MTSICICGGGNAAHVFGGLLSSNPSLHVRIFTSFGNEAEKLSQGPIEVHTPSGIIHGKPDIVTKSAEIAVTGADIILLSVPAFAHETILRSIANFIKPGAWVGALPTQSGFEWAAQRVLKERVEPGRGDVVIFGMHTLPMACRIMEFGRSVEVSGFKSEIFLSALPAEAVQRVASRMYELIGVPMLTSRSFLNISLVPANQIVHPGVMCGLFEDWEEGVVYPKPFEFYHGMTERSAELVTAMSDECQALKRRLQELIPGLDLHLVWPMHEMIRHLYPEQIGDNSTLRSCFTSNKTYEGLLAPMIPVDDGFVPDFRSRYLTEDLPCGLVVFKGIAELADVPTPTIDKVLQWAQKKIGKEYLDENNSLQGKDVASTRAPQAFGLQSIADIATLEALAPVIIEADAFLLKVPLVAPYRVSYGTITHADVVIVKLVSSSGHVGWGEANPLVPFTDETPESVYAVLKDRLLPEMLHFSATEVNKAERMMDSTVSGNMVAKGAINIAMWDLLGKIQSVSVSSLLGGCLRQKIDLLWPMGSQDAEEDLEVITNKKAEGFHTFMLKIGARDSSPEKDALRIQQLAEKKEELGDVHLCADANGGYTLQQARKFCQLTRDCTNLDFLEQPLSPTEQPQAWDSLTSVCSHSLSADESVQSKRDAVAICAGGVFDVLSIKVSKNGGISGALALGKLAGLSGKKVLCNSMLEMGITQAAMMHVAALLPNLVEGGHCFMSTLRLAENVTNFKTMIRNGILHLPVSAPGLGVEVNEEKVRALAVETCCLTTDNKKKEKCE